VRTPGSGERGRVAVEPHARQPVKAHHLDQRSDLGLRAGEEDRPSPRAKPPGEHGQIQHQRRVGEHQLGEIHDNIRLRGDGLGEGPPPDPLRYAVLVSRAAKDRRMFIEADD
jgi:hypothetical protein